MKAIVKALGLKEHHLKLFKVIYDGAVEYEDGETGMDRCIELFCEDNTIDDQTCEWVQRVAFIKGATEAGIPLQVALGKKKLTDYFSQDYIDQQCGLR